MFALSEFGSGKPRHYNENSEVGVKRIVTKQHPSAPKNTFKLIKAKGEHMGNLRFRIGMGLFNYHHKILLTNSLEEINQHGALPICGALLVCAYGALMKESPQTMNWK